MGLFSAMNSALTGLSAAETQIDITGNNLANSQTTAFKASRAVFSEQLVRTQSLGAAPTPTNGGTIPRQVGLGVKVAAIQPDFSQGSIATSSSPTDVAIQGEGFFVLEATGGEIVYSRSGEFSLNAIGEIVNVDGARLLGQTADDDFVLQPVLEPLSVALGQQIAIATENVVWAGVLSPTGDVATAASIVESEALGDGSVPFPTTGGNQPVSVAGPTSPASAAPSAGVGAMEAGDYQYRVVFTDASGNESAASAANTAVTVSAGDAVDLTGISQATAGPPANWTGRRLYRSMDGGAYTRLQDIADLTTTTFTDTASQASISSNPTLASTSSPGTGSFQYRIAFSSSAGTLPTTRPSPILGTVNLSAGTSGLLTLTGLPVQADLPTGYDRINVYRTQALDPTTFYLASEVTPSTGTETVFIDSMADAVLVQQPEMDPLGPDISSTTLLSDVVRLNSSGAVEQVFPSVGTLNFTGRKNFVTTETQGLTVDATTTVGDLTSFLSASLGTQTDTDPVDPIPVSTTPSGAVAPPGGSVQNGLIQLVGNNGIPIEVSDLSFTDSAGNFTSVGLLFGETQEAVGESVTASFFAYDTLGVPVDLRVNMVLESSGSDQTRFRWFAETADNQPVGGGVDIAVGTGLLSFDGEGNVVSTTNTTVSVERNGVPSLTPLRFDFDFSNLGGLATGESAVFVRSQDGAPTGTLTGFNIGEDGGLSGNFSNGEIRTIGQIRMARFANNQGLERRGNGLFRQGINSGLLVEGNPSERGIGSLIVGARELSNADVGTSLIDLITATTLYRGNTRVITTTQDLIDELLNIRR